MNKKPSAVEIVAAAVGVVAALVAASFALDSMRGQTVYKETADFSTGVARFEFTLSDQANHHIYLTTNMHYSDRYHYRVKAELISPDGTVYEEEVTDIESSVDASRNTESTRRLLLKLPPGIGVYKLTLSVDEKSGDVTLDRVTITVKKRP